MKQGYYPKGIDGKGKPAWHINWYNNWAPLWVPAAGAVWIVVLVRGGEVGQGIAILFLFAVLGLIFYAIHRGQ